MSGILNSLGSSLERKKLECFSMSGPRHFRTSLSVFIVTVLNGDGRFILYTKAWTWGNFDFRCAREFSWLSGKYSRPTWNVSLFSHDAYSSFPFLTICRICFFAETHDTRLRWLWKFVTIIIEKQSGLLKKLSVYGFVLQCTAHAILCSLIMLPFTLSDAPDLLLLLYCTNLSILNGSWSWTWTDRPEEKISSQISLPSALVSCTCR